MEEQGVEALEVTNLWQNLARKAIVDGIEADKSGDVADSYQEASLEVVEATNVELSKGLTLPSYREMGPPSSLLEVVRYSRCSQHPCSSRIVLEMVNLCLEGEKLYLSYHG